jgi:hypothetical protein
MTRQGKKLVFISWIKPDGSSIVVLSKNRWQEVGYPKIDDMTYLDNDVFKLTRLSLTNKTYIASGFNSFVVKLK